MTSPTTHDTSHSPPASSWALRALITTVTALTFAALAFGGFKLRGVGEPGLWLATATDHVTPWLAHGMPLSHSALDEAWRHQAAMPPLTVFLVSALRLLNPTMSVFEAGRLINCAALALTAPCLWALARRAGGPPAAAGAVVAWLFTPRIFGVAGLPGFTAMAVCGLVFAVFALYRARTSRAWTLIAPLALAAAVLTCPTSALLLLPWALLTLSDRGQVTTILLKKGRDPDAPNGFLRPASFPLRLLAVPVAAALLCVALYPWTWQSPATRMTAYLTHFALTPHEPFLFMGRHINHGHLPLWGPLTWLIITLPPVTAALGLFGVIGEMLLQPLGQSALRTLSPSLRINPDPEAAGPEARESKRWAFSALFMTLLTPWALGPVHFGPIDLLALAVPFWAVFAGCALSRLFSSVATAVRRSRVSARVSPALALGLFGGLVFAPAILDSVDAFETSESYYSWAIGGTDGAVAMGMGRNPGGPVLISVARHISDTSAAMGGDAALAIPVDEKRHRAVLSRLQRDRLIDAVPPPAPLDAAPLILLPHVDADPDYHHVARDFAALIDPKDSMVVRREHIRLFTLGQRPAATQP